MKPLPNNVNNVSKKPIGTLYNQVNNMLFTVTSCNTGTLLDLVVWCGRIKEHNTFYIYAIWKENQTKCNKMFPILSNYVIQLLIYLICLKYISNLWDDYKY